MRTSTDKGDSLCLSLGSDTEKSMPDSSATRFKILSRIGNNSSGLIGPLGNTVKSKSSENL